MQQPLLSVYANASAPQLSQLPPYAPSAPPLPTSHEPPRQPQQRLSLQSVLARFEITVADTNDLALLAGWDIVILCDDSGSMMCPTSMGGGAMSGYGMGAQCVTRWDELKSTVQTLTEIAVCFDEDGLDIYFLNRPPITCVKSSHDPRLVQAFQQPPSGTTPLVQAMQYIVKEREQKGQPTLLFIATDGIPNEGPAAFKKCIEDIIHRRCCRGTYRFHIMACTADEHSVSWLNEFDQQYKEVDVTDDYWSERKEVMATGRYREFRPSDWVIKALLGTLSRKFDEMDEPSRRKHSQGEKSTCCTVL